MFFNPFSKYHVVFQVTTAVVKILVLPSPNFSDFSIILALLLREEGKIQESLELFQRTVQINANNVDNLKQVARSLYVENSLSYLTICRNISVN